MRVQLQQTHIAMQQAILYKQFGLDRKRLRRLLLGARVRLLQNRQRQRHARTLHASQMEHDRRVRERGRVEQQLHTHRRAVTDLLAPQLHIYVEPMSELEELSLNRDDMGKIEKPAR